MHTEVSESFPSWTVCTICVIGGVGVGRGEEDEEEQTACRSFQIGASA